MRLSPMTIASPPTGSASAESASEGRGAGREAPRTGKRASGGLSGPALEGLSAIPNLQIAPAPGGGAAPASLPLARGMFDTAARLMRFAVAGNA